MPHIKTETISARNEAGATASFKAKLAVNSQGDFYAAYPDYLNEPISQFVDGETIWKGRHRDGSKLFSNSLATLTQVLGRALRSHLTPEITESLVIAYNIESHVNFAQDEEGNIFPNAGFEGAQWPEVNGSAELYGNHHAAKPSEGGYSLTVGAVALRKITYRYGTAEKSQCERYYGDDGHLGHDNPASLLNSWCSFSLPEAAKEMPYTDEAATFFHNLMLGMAEISKRIQFFASDETKLKQLIASGSQPLLAKQE